jgi:glycosyltransferase involved in cell wall biosynthesis
MASSSGNSTTSTGRSTSSPASIADVVSRPLVSIVVPAYNSARHIRDSLSSILAQRYRPIEVLVMDDASTDETPALVAEYGDAVAYHRQRVNRGQFDNVNDGIALARGEMVAVYHADDVYLPTIVEREVEFLEHHPDAGAVFCLDVFIDAEGREYDRLVLPDELRGGGILTYERVLDALLRHNNTFLRTPGAMVRAATYRTVGPYRPEFGSCADLEMWVRIARAFPVGLIDEHLYRYRHTEGQVFRQYERARVAPHRNFDIIDRCVAEQPALASAGARRRYEAHRAEDTLMRAARHYVRGQLSDVRRLLAGVSTRVILTSGRHNRARLLVMLLGLRVLTRLPRIPRVADTFRRRWEERAPGKR